MPKYRVEIHRLYSERAFVEVEADDEDDAKDHALEEADMANWTQEGVEVENVEGVEEVDD